MRFNTHRLGHVLFAPILIILITACSGFQGPVRINVYLTPEPGAPTPAPTAIPAVDVALTQVSDLFDNDDGESLGGGATPLPAGRGDVTGRIIWNDAPVVNQLTALCASISFMTKDCTGQTYFSTTDDNGIFFFPDVKDGDYVVAVNFDDAQGWVPIKSGLGIVADKFSVTGFSANRLGDLVVMRENIAIEFPGEGVELLADELDIRWAPYPEAAYYIVYLAPDEGDAIIAHERYETSDITVSPARLLNCEYALKIDAHNSLGTQIAESRSYRRFRITGEDANCVLNVGTPLDGSSVLYNGSLLLDWDPHPDATYYRILMWYDTDPDHPHILSFAETSESQYLLDVDLEPGRYVWSINAHRADKVEVAGSHILDFQVR